jgi:hypothetical protein
VGVNLRKKTMLKVSRELRLVVPRGGFGPPRGKLKAANLGG